MTIRPVILAPAPGQQEFVERLLTGSQAKTAFALRMNAEKMIRDCPGGLESIGFLTLTIGEFEAGPMLPGQFRRFRQVKDSNEANRRINNLARRVLPDLFERCIIVTERHKSGAIHFHALGVVKGMPDIRTGFDFKAVAARDYSSVSARLRAVWAWLRNTLPGYGFGRAELLPVRKTGEAVASYVSKYIEKNVCNRLKADARKKLVRYQGFAGTQLKPNEFEWNTPRAQAWRAKARALADLVHVTLPDILRRAPEHVTWACLNAKGYIRPRQLDGTVARQVLGSRWAWTLTQTWRTALGDDLRQGFGWTWEQKCVLRRELIRKCGHEWYERKEAWKIEDGILVEIAEEPFTLKEWRDFMGETPVCVLSQLRRN